MTGQNTDAQIQGKVLTPDGEPIANAYIQVKNSFNEAVSNENGEFSINASSSDILIASAFLKYKKEVSINDGQSLLITLHPNRNVLDEVVLRQKVEKEKEIVTPYGNQKKKAVGYAHRVLEEDFFRAADIDVFTALRRVQGIVAKGESVLFFQREFRSKITPIPIQVFVDNVPAEQSILFVLSPNQIESITAISSLAGLVKYGTTASGGVLLIETKVGAQMNEKKPTTPSLLAKGNDYSEELQDYNQGVETKHYLKELRKSTSFDEAKLVFFAQKNESNASKLSYYLETAEYFNKWDQNFAHSILSELFRKAGNNSKVLLAIAYQCEESGFLNQAMYVYQELMLLEPDKAQSYRNLALIYAKVGNYELANSLYRQMLFNSVPNVDFLAVENIIIHEYRNFIAKHKSKVNYQGLPGELLVANFKKDVRLVFEWTNPLSQFEIQFVGPQKKFYNWQHSSVTSTKFMEDEIKFGHSMKEFVVDDAEKGEWLVNITSLSEESSNVPTYIKYTIYKDYGLPSETSEVKVINLYNFNKKLTLDNFLD
jgi:hypothetical protein